TFGVNPQVCLTGFLTLLVHGRPQEIVDEFMLRHGERKPFTEPQSGNANVGGTLLARPGTDYPEDKSKRP
ncbi:MAG: hypothetical protein ACJ8AI_09845, partial [Rhodopila sp.]